MFLDDFRIAFFRHDARSVDRGLARNRILLLEGYPAVLVSQILKVASLWCLMHLFEVLSDYKVGILISIELLYRIVALSEVELIATFLLVRYLRQFIA